MPAAPARDPLYRGNRVPAEIICSAVWRYPRFPLSDRDSEDLLAERGVQGSDDAIRLWCRTFGPDLDAGLRRHRRPGRQRTARRPGASAHLSMPPHRQMPSLP